MREGLTRRAFLRDAALAGVAPQEAQPGHLHRGHAQMWEQRPIVAAAMVAERAAETRGVKHAELITARLVQEERGWLRLEGQVGCFSLR